MPLALPSWLSAPTALAAAWKGRSFWELELRDGTVYRESVGSDWPLMPTRGRVAVRLLCPNGQAVEFRAPGADGTGRFFQLKCAELRQAMSWSPTDGMRVVPTTKDGATIVWQHPADPTAPRPAPIPARRVLAHVVGIIEGTDGTARCAAWEYDATWPAKLPGGGRLVTFVDNANNLAYRHVGPLASDHLGLARP